MSNTITILIRNRNSGGQQGRRSRSRAPAGLTPIAPTVGGLRGVLVGANVGLSVFLQVVWLLAGFAATVVAIMRKRNVTERSLSRLVPA